MKTRDIAYDLSHYPCYEVKDGKLIRIPTPTSWHGVVLHHYIRTGWIDDNPEKFEQVRHLQKLIFMPRNMHNELHAKHSRFKEKYGIEIKELLFDWREYMISAKKAREKSDVNSINILRADIEKLINKAVEKGLHAVFKTGQVPQILIDEIMAAGFDIEFCPTGIKIMW